MNVFSDYADIDQGIITMMLGDIKQATEDTKTAPNKTRGAPEGKASRETGGYKKQDYERYGWAREAGIVSFNNMSDLESKLKTKKSLKDFQQSMRGEAIVAVNEHPNSTLEVNNTLLYVVGSRNFPKITKVIKINLYNETDIELVERSIYESEQQSWSRASSFMANLFEAELVREYSPKDFPNYQEYKTKSKQPSGGLESQRDNGNNQPFSKRTGDNSKNKGKFSRELDTDYLNAVNRGDMETAQRFNEENEDIRYSRDLDIEGDSASEFAKPRTNRELLANALLDTVQKNNKIKGCHFRDNLYKIKY